MRQDVYEEYQAQDALQQRQLDAQSAMNSPQMLEQIQQAQSVLVESTNPKKVIEDIILVLKGQEKLPNGNTHKSGKEKMNKLGIENISFILKSHINQNVILSRLQDFEISQIMDSLQKDLVDDLALNWKDYGITKKTDLDTINNCVLINIFLTLKRAEGQNEKNWLSKISIENISQGGGIPRPKKESFWSKFSLQR